MSDFILTNLPCSGRILIVADAVTEQAVCTSGSVVEYRLAKARVAGSNPVSCSSLRSGIIVNSMVPIFCVQRKVYTNVYRQKSKIKRPCGLEFFEGVGTLSSPLKCYE